MSGRDVGCLWFISVRGFLFLFGFGYHQFSCDSLGDLQGRQWSWLSICSCSRTSRSYLVMRDCKESSISIILNGSSTSDFQYINACFTLLPVKVKDAVL